MQDVDEDVRMTLCKHVLSKKSSLLPRYLLPSRRRVAAGGSLPVVFFAARGLKTKLLFLEQRLKRMKSLVEKGRLVHLGSTCLGMRKSPNDGATMCVPGPRSHDVEFLRVSGLSESASAAFVVVLVVVDVSSSSCSTRAAFVRLMSNQCHMPHRPKPPFAKLQALSISESQIRHRSEGMASVTQWMFLHTLQPVQGAVLIEFT